MCRSPGGHDVVDYETELKQRIDEVLHYIWDPIGVAAGVPEARDEYSDYVVPAFELLQANASADQISEHLDKLVTERMGLDSNKEESTRVALLLIRWKEVLLLERPMILGPR
jgi:hypothetical protein